jgi:hypothetical protein
LLLVEIEIDQAIVNCLTKIDHLFEKQKQKNKNKNQSTTRKTTEQKKIPIK